ncbi:hypothetical protein [Spiroplasma endosymbiont of Polydrusus formosus]|uniref:hypothetical protein n=1 Tax=Spiroplasma endosymbiont of Polydrusus formosus TaxID=3139326 RepID=UPI0035B564C6
MFNSNASYLAFHGSILLAGVSNGILDLAIDFYGFRKTTFSRQLHLLKVLIYHLVLVLVLINLITSLVGSLRLLKIAFLSYKEAIRVEWINWYGLFWAIILWLFLAFLFDILIAFCSNYLKVILVMAILLFIIFCF